MITVKTEKTKSNKIKLIVWISLCAFAAVFALINAALNAKISGEFSNWARDVLIKITYVISGNRNFYTYFTYKDIRTTGHLVIYFFLGFFASGIAFSIKRYFGKFNLFLWAFVLLAVPVADEYLQSFSSGRHSRLHDVVFDFVCAVLGFLLWTAIFLIINHYKNKKTV